MSVLFAASDPIAVPSLCRLYERDLVHGILTAPPVGNHPPSAVMRCAAARHLPCLTFHTLDSNACEEVARAGYRLLVCFAYGRFFPSAFLARFSAGAINAHPSLLPRFRGASPLAAAILAGDMRTGITIQGISDTLDAGDIYAQIDVPLDERIHRSALQDIVAELAAQPLAAVAQALYSNRPPATYRQDERMAVYCRKLRKNDGRIEWAMGAHHIQRLVRAMHGWPGAHTTLHGAHLRILEAAIYPTDDGHASHPVGAIFGVDTRHGLLVQTGIGILAITHLQLATKRAHVWSDFVHGQPHTVGARLI